jgi:ABC-2 type transport system ATP-binding protein
MVRRIRERGKTVLLTTHLMEEAQRLCDRIAIVDRGHVIDVGTPGELVRTHCPEQTVIVAAEPAAASHFQRIPDVESVAVNDAQITIRSRRDNLVTDVITCIAEHRIRVTDFRTELPTLEDVFLRLTGRSIRE